MANESLLARKRRTAEEAAALLRPVDTLALGLGTCHPPAFLRALARRDWQKLTVFGALLGGLFELFTRPGVTYLSGFYGPVERGLLAAGHDVRFVPADFRRFEAIARRLAPRVMATLATPPDAHGRLSLSLHAGATVDELHRAGRDPDRLLVVETSPKLPRTLGLPPAHMHALTLDEVDVLIEGDGGPLEIPDLPPNDVQRRIAQLAARRIAPGSTIQTGIGGIPSEIAALLAEGSGGDYGIHGEMFTDGLMKLHQAGKVTNRKGLYDGLSICTFALGSSELYRWLDGNELVRFLPVDHVNDPSLMAKNRSMVSINGALSIDLYGQVAADTIDGRQFSGIGGHEDFTAGAALAPGGRSLVCMPATSRVKGAGGERVVSRIVAQLPAGAIVTTPRHQIDEVVTEYGVAELAAKDVAERAAALAEIAHPDFRDELRAAAKKLAR